MKKYIYNIIALCLLLSSIICAGQIRQQKKGDSSFETYNYVHAIDIYKNIVERGYMNSTVLSRLGDSYYFNGKLTDAYLWYDKMFESSYKENDISKLDPEYYFRYAQTLKSVNQHQRADEIFKVFADLKASDSRVLLFMSNKKLHQKTQEAPRFSLENLEINTRYSEYVNALVNNELIFTSSRGSNEIKNVLHDWTDQSFTQIYGSRVLSDGTFEQPSLYAKEIIKTDLNMSTVSFSHDGKSMYFTSNSRSSRRARKKSSRTNNIYVLKIYRATKQKNNTWGNIEELPFNSESYNTAHPALSPDGKWLYFASDREESIGQADLFRVAIELNGEFGEVQALAEYINTEARESFPYISSENILYFASDGHPGFGGLDLFSAKINDDGSIEKPVNMGPDINSNFDDFAIVFDEKNDQGFFSSNRPSGLGADDMYSFKTLECVQQLTGSINVVDTGESLDAVEIRVLDDQLNLVSSFSTDDQGLFHSDNLLCGKEYRVRVIKQGYYTQEFIVYTDRDSLQNLIVELEPDGGYLQLGPGLFKKIGIEAIHFDFDRSTITAQASIELMKIVELMNLYPSIEICLSAHTDSIGSTKYNLSLSNRRAKSVFDWMVSQGIDSKRLSSKGFGETKLLYRCEKGTPCPEEALNRRVEFSISKL